MEARTKRYLADLNPKYRRQLNWIRSGAVGDRLNTVTESEKKLVRSEIRGYLSALEAAEIITHVQFRCLYVYYTLNI